jgi:hypothetical protein
MKRTFSNRPVAAIVAVFTLISAWLLHGNPFGAGEIAWPVALLVALLGNLLLAYVVTGWAAPYLASTGGRAGAENADPQAVAVAERWTAGTLLLFGSLALLAVTLAATDIVITPTKRLEENAALVKKTVESAAPAEYQRQLGGADTWKMSPRTYRSCVPKPESITVGFCVVTQVQDGHLKVVKYGVAKSNAAQALEWHPELKDQKRQFE